MPIIEGWFFVLLIKPFYSFMCPNFCSYVFRLTTYLVFMPIRTFRLLLVLKCGMKSLVIPFIRYNILFHSEHHYTRLAYLVFIGVWTYYSDFFIYYGSSYWTNLALHLFALLKFQDIGTFFMNIVNSSHSYATGGTSVSEFW